MSSSAIFGATAIAKGSRDSSFMFSLVEENETNSDLNLIIDSLQQLRYGRHLLSSKAIEKKGMSRISEQ